MGTRNGGREARREGEGKKGKKQKKMEGKRKTETKPASSLTVPLDS